MKILVISYCFPPLSSAETYVGARILSGLAEQGHELTVVLASGSHVYGRDPSSLELVSPRIRAEAVAACELPLPLHRALHKVGRSFLYAPDPMRRWAAPAARKIDALLSAQRFDLIYSRAQPFTSHLAVLRARGARGLPWVAHCSDPLVDNPFTGSARLHRWLNERIERRIFSAATQVHFTSQETVTLVSRRYSPETVAKFRCVGHCFGVENYPTVEGWDCVRKTTTLAHVGSFTGERNPTNFMLALARLRERKPQVVAQLKVRFVGADPRRLRNNIAELNLADIIELVPRVTYMESLQEMCRNDLLLLIDAKFNGTSIFFPSKLTDYLGSGSEILAITPKVGATARILAEVGRGDVAEPDDIEEIANLIEMKVCKHRRHKPPAAYSTNAVVSDLSRQLEAAAGAPVLTRHRR